MPFCRRWLLLPRALLPALMLLSSLSLRAPARAQPRFADEAQEAASVLALVRERLSLMPAVAAYKWTHQLAVYDAAREQSVLAQIAAQAETLGLDSESTSGFFVLQMRLARVVQERAIARFRESGRCDVAVVDLQTVLRPQLERISGAMLTALARTAPSLRTVAPSEPYAQQAARLLGQVDLTREESDELLRALAQVRASGASRMESILARKVLRVGTTGDYPPFSLERNERLSGADIALVQGFARSLKLPVRFVRTSWPTLIQDLQRGVFDLAASGVSVTPERAAVARFSVPYHHGGKTAIARCVARAELDSLAKIDKPAVRVIVNPGGTNEAFARTQLTHAQLLVFPDNRSIFTEILQGRADVMITDDVEVALQVKRHRELCRTTPELFAPGDKAWIMPPDSELADSVDRWLAPRVQNGTAARALSTAIERAR